MISAEPTQMRTTARMRRSPNRYFQRPPLLTVPAAVIVILRLCGCRCSSATVTAATVLHVTLMQLSLCCEPLLLYCGESLQDNVESLEVTVLWSTTKLLSCGCHCSQLYCSCQHNKLLNVLR